jgi:hypothetical protein
MPYRVRVERRGIPDDQHRAAGAREPDVDPTLVRDKPDLAALAGAHRREYGNLLLPPLEMAIIKIFRVADPYYLPLSTRYLTPRLGFQNIVTSIYVQPALLCNYLPRVASIIPPEITN